MASIIKQVRSRCHAARTAKRRMEKRALDTLNNDVWLHRAKRRYQEESRALVRSGARTQESMIFIPKDLIKASTFRRRTDEF